MFEIIYRDDHQCLADWPLFGDRKLVSYFVCDVVGDDNVPYVCHNSGEISTGDVCCVNIEGDNNQWHFIVGKYIETLI